MTGNLTKQNSQIINIDGSYVLSKSQIYLRNNFFSNKDSFQILADAIVIDSLNLFKLSVDGNEKIIMQNTIAGFTGVGYLSHYVDFFFISPKIIYPIKFLQIGQYQVWIRYSNSGPSFSANIYLQNDYYGTISSAMVNSSWVWDKIDIIVDERLLLNRYMLGIELTEDASFIDEIIIQKTGQPLPVGSVSVTSSPYSTVLSYIYEVDMSNTPTSLLDIFDFKTTLAQIVSDGWYSFDTSRRLSSSPVLPNGNYALTSFAVGSTIQNFVMWQKGDVDTIVYPSVFET